MTSSENKKIKQKKNEIIKQLNAIYNEPDSNGSQNNVWRAIKTHSLAIAVLQTDIEWIKNDLQWVKYLLATVIVTVLVNMFLF